MRCPLCGFRSLCVRELERGEPVEVWCGLGCAAGAIGRVLAEIVAANVEPPKPRRPVFVQASPLDEIPAREFVEALSGREVSRFGFACCPFHEDDTASLKAYDKPLGSWYCHGCNRGGRIWDFGAELYGITPRGRGFHEIRERLERDLGVYSVGRAA